MSVDLGTPLELPCGAILSNRIAKASMTEGLADVYDDATARLCHLYQVWSGGGAGLLLTGNVMIDRRFLERPGNVVLDQETDLAALRRWGQAGTARGNHLWIQLNHPGRQAQRTSALEPLAPSEVGLDMLGLFGRPRALTVAEIHDIFDRYRFAARAAKDAGFTGVQVHSAHGYLSSQFLSPRTNRRTDEWGGSLRNRARFLVEAVRAVRDAVGPEFPVSVKLNSADFSQGGFSNEDAAQVAAWLEEERIDLLEISGGTYESIAFVDGGPQAEGTRRREAYFLEYAKVIRAAAPATPLMVTGGFRRRATMEAVLADAELDMVGLGRPFCVMPDVARRLVSGELDEAPTPERGLRLARGKLGPTSENRSVRALNSLAGTAFFYEQIVRLAEGQPLAPAMTGRQALLRHLGRDTRTAVARKRCGRSTRS